ncbi:hypothetical protein [Hymenobacter properus]|uniref:Uncharacterized protein n=1 Tax=Hymenobacter properus TaxID=2791026 RepID=A0A931FL58_9BACT|nr:hypothetical protein [Hymenobacter properus]MBF9140384.1 hypothetical protein [Hymenobacter properus]MBR7719191.1 hypothetical protein [Microvirga sp. SRT04]
MRSFLLLSLLLLGAGSVLAQPTGKAAKGRKRYTFAQRDSESPYVQNVTKNTDEEQEVDGSFTRLGYRSAADMLKEIDALRKLKDWADSTYQRRLAAIPPGGALVVTVHRQGPKGVEMSNLTLTVTDKAGKEVFAQTLPAGTGRFFGRDLYQGKTVLPFPKMEAQELNVSIRDAKLYQTFDYILTLPAAQ